MNLKHKSISFQKMTFSMKTRVVVMFVNRNSTSRYVNISRMCKTSCTNSKGYVGYYKRMLKLRKILWKHPLVYFNDLLIFLIYCFLVESIRLLVVVRIVLELFIIICDSHIILSSEFSYILSRMFSNVSQIDDWIYLRFANNWLNVINFWDFK